MTPASTTPGSALMAGIAAGFATGGGGGAGGFGVWIATLPSMPGSTVYLTARMSPRMVFAACGAGTLTRLHARLASKKLYNQQYSWFIPVRITVTLYTIYRYLGFYAVITVTVYTVPFFSPCGA